MERLSIYLHCSDTTSKRSLILYLILYHMLITEKSKLLITEKSKLLITEESKLLITEESRLLITEESKLARFARSIARVL